MGGGGTFRGYWCGEEEEALRRGVQKHGIGAWERIRHDPEFKILKGRTGVQLKDKWRNLIKFQHVGRDEAIRAPLRCYRSTQRRTRREGTRSRGGGDSEDGKTTSSPPPEQPDVPLTDFERSRLDNIRRNQEALAALMEGTGVSDMATSRSPDDLQTGARHLRASSQGEEDEHVVLARTQHEVAAHELACARDKLAAADAEAQKVEAAYAEGALTAEELDGALKVKEEAETGVQEAARKAQATSVLIRQYLGEDDDSDDPDGHLLREPERQSARVASKPRKTYVEDENAPAEGDTFRPEPISRVVEDRRFGIYDARRYRYTLEDGTSDDGGAAAAEPQRRQRTPGSAKRRRRARSDEDDSDDGDDEDEDEALPQRSEATPRRRPPPPRRAHARTPGSASRRQPPRRAKASEDGMPDGDRTAESGSEEGPKEEEREAFQSQSESDSGSGEEDTYLWELQFERGWGVRCMRTTVARQAAAASVRSGPVLATLPPQETPRKALPCVQEDAAEIADASCPGAPSTSHEPLDRGDDSIQHWEPAGGLLRGPHEDLHLSHDGHDNHHIMHDHHHHHLTPEDLGMQDADDTMLQVLDDGPGVLLAEIELIGVLGPSQLHPSEGLTA